jgi:hypothetical protein
MMIPLIKNYQSGSPRRSVRRLWKRRVQKKRRREKKKVRKKTSRCIKALLSDSELSLKVQSVIRGRTK